MQRSWRFGALLALALVSACGRRAATGGSAPMDVRPFAAFASQRIVVTPLAVVRGGDSLGWVDGMGGSRATARQFDSLLVRVLDDRGLAQGWILPAALQRTYERNRSYANDPYQLAIQPLRMTSFESGSRYGEPLSSQLRTLIALENEARFVLLPVELRFEREESRMRGVVRLAFLDPRAAEAQWVGEVKGDLAADPPRALATVAARVADLFVAP